jgi:RNA recognition motif-containing protein
MNENSTERSGRRRRGGRRRSSNRRAEPRAETRTAPAAARQPTLWQKIVAFFTGKSKSNGSSASVQPARKYPAYEPRSQQQHKRFEDGTATSTTETAESPRPSRKPEAIEVTTPKLYVGNLSFDAGESDLLDLFNGVGKVQNAEIVAHRETEKSKGFGFVTMNSIEEARRAVSELHDKEFMGRKLVVSGAKTPPGR